MPDPREEHPTSPVRDPRYADTAEAASVLGITRNAVCKRLRHGTIPGRRFKGEWGVLRKWLDGRHHHV